MLLGDGNGGFAGPTTFPAGSYPLSIAVGDFNGDSRPDLATSGVRVLLSGLIKASINDVSRTEGGFGQTDFTFTLSLNGATADPVQVGFNTQDGTATIATPTTPLFRPSPSTSPLDNPPRP